ncbi:MAG: tyrosine--tRNA ligase, partial [Gemmatimonadetes bacterium]|nr:tyrosine--tRNA ligase [Gemmatimonadota bacterium]
PALTSPYRFYQFWMAVDDRDVIRYIRYFTLLGPEEISGLESTHAERPHERTAHRALAEDVTRRVHGSDGLASAQRATEVLFGGEIAGLRADEIAEVFSDVPASEMARAGLEGDGTGVLDLFAEAGVCKSRGEARRSIEGGGLSVNNVRVEHVEAVVRVDDAIEGRFLLLRKGKKNYHMVRVV